MDITLREYALEDLEQVREIWNGVVAEGDSFPQDAPLDKTSAEAFFAGQSYTGVAESGREIVGLYILHPNNVGRCGHIANASYAVKKGLRGRHIGERLVRDSIAVAASLSFKILQYNAVVATNEGAIRLYDRLGFKRLGVIPGGFRLDGGVYEDIIPFYIRLDGGGRDG